MINIAFTGGGTGGHIYPGLAVVDELRSLAAEGLCNKDLNFCWIGSNNGRDARIVEKSGSIDKFYSIPSGKLRRYFSLRNITDIFRIFAGFVKSFFILAKLKPAFLFSKGGFVSVPPCVAARLLKIPVYTHECDFSPGLATRINKRFATKIFVSYEETAKFFGEGDRNRVVCTGNPVRPAFYEASAENGREFLKIDEKLRTRPIVLVLGGSLGSRQVNELIWESLSYLTQKFVVVHQCGEADAEKSFQLQNSDESGAYLVYPFIYKEMCDVIAAADIVVARAGANNLSECAVLKKPLVLVPLSKSGSRGDQLENAKFFADNGAAIVLSGEEATAENLKRALERLSDKKTREEFSENCGKVFPQHRPAKKIAEILSELIQS